MFLSWRNSKATSTHSCRKQFMNSCERHINIFWIYKIGTLKLGKDFIHWGVSIDIKIFEFFQLFYPIGSMYIPNKILQSIIWIMQHRSDQHFTARIYSIRFYGYTLIIMIMISIMILLLLLKLQIVNDLYLLFAQNGQEWFKGNLRSYILIQWLLLET